MEKSGELHPIEQYTIDIVSKIRHEHKLTQAEIGKILNTQGAFIGNVENLKNPAKYNLKHINILAAHFGISPKVFLPEKPI